MLFRMVGGIGGWYFGDMVIEVFAYMLNKGIPKN
jgi:hypothetical protein